MRRDLKRRYESSEVVSEGPQAFKPGLRRQIEAANGRCGTVEHPGGCVEDDWLSVFRIRGSTGRASRYFSSQRAFSNREISSAVL
jgi:hypothetical protein